MPFHAGSTHIFPVAEMPTATSSTSATARTSPLYGFEDYIGGQARHVEHSGARALCRPGISAVAERELLGYAPYPIQARELSDHSSESSRPASEPPEPALLPCM
jgi:hypothetical protein